MSDSSKAGPGGLNLLTALEVAEQLEKEKRHQRPWWKIASRALPHVTARCTAGPMSIARTRSARRV